MILYTYKKEIKDIKIPQYRFFKSGNKQLIRMCQPIIDKLNSFNFRKH